MIGGCIKIQQIISPCNQLPTLSVALVSLSNGPFLPWIREYSDTARDLATTGGTWYSCK